MGFNAHGPHFASRRLPTQVPMPTRVPILAIILTMTATTALAAGKRAHKPSLKPQRCEVRIHQPAASVVLNRTTAPASICVQGCDAKLVGVHREAGQLAALAIYSGRRCLPADGGPAEPRAKPKSKAKPKPKLKLAAKPAPGLSSGGPLPRDGTRSRMRD